MHVILGTGPIGAATATALVRAGHPVRMLSRSRRPTAGSVPEQGIDYGTVDVTDSAAVLTATAGATAIHNCINPPTYTRWRQDWPPMAAAILDAAQAHDAVLVTAANLYNYGRGSGPMSEATPERPTDEKGEIRSRMWAQALERHRAGRVRVAEARASDYVGPFAVVNAHGGGRLVEPMLAGKTLRPLGKPDVPHSWTYLPDIGATMAALATDSRAWGRIWHVPSPEPLTFRELATRYAAAAGAPIPRISPIPHLALTVGSWVNPMMRELAGVEYQFTDSFVTNSSAATTELGLTATPWEEITAATMAWWAGRTPTT